jgi:N-acetylglucosamine-6-phosphate deacetylase
MKNPAYRGAHNPDYFYPADPGIFDTLQSAAENRIRVVNIPPEHGAAGLELIRYLSEKNVICAAGHTGATANKYKKAMEAGLTLAIHFLNGPTGSSSKPFDGGGAVEAILQSDAVHLELITDGYHVSKPYVLDTIARKGEDRVAVITDCMFLTGLQDTVTFNMFGIDGRVSQNREYLQVADQENILFGSVLTMDKAFSNILTWMTSDSPGIWQRMHEARPFEQALVAASKMCSTTPAEIVRLDDRGEITEGKRADLIVASIEQKQAAWDLRPETVFSNGRKTQLC